MKYYHILWDMDDNNPDEPNVLLVTEKSSMDDYLFTPEQRRIDDNRDRVMMDRIFRAPFEAKAIEMLREHWRKGCR